jgi:membrane peptidoglycan carboxypeptidase
MVQPVIGPTDREPSLLTHHEHNGSSPDDFDYDDGPYTGDQARFNEVGQDDDGYDDEPEYDENGKLKKPPLTPKQRKKRRWKIIRRVLYAMFGLFVVVPAIVFVIMYFSVDVPSPDSVAAKQSQAVTYYFSDGTTVMGKDTPPQGNRIILKYEQIPDIMRRAVYATEDDTFETNSGFDITGILRAVYNQATGSAGGGSTISQQYIKKATGNEDATLTRKATELVQSFKMNQTYSKNDIITAYLNTVYFGNGAYGVGAAAQTFYNKNVLDLTASEAALLAGLIQQPGRAGKPEVQQARWTVAIDRMRKNNFITQAERDSAVLPVPVERTEKDQKAGEVNTFIKARVLDELADQGFDDDKLYAGGYKVVTTIDPKAQTAAEQAVTDAMKGQVDPEILNALVATDPKTGGILAYYGGPTLATGPEGQQLKGRDRANEARNPGSSIKAFDLTAFLQMGRGLGETFDGRSPRTFPGVAKPIRNAGDSLNCGEQCTVAAAMEVSANTVFYDMVLNVTKPARVAKAARAAGVKDASEGGRSKLGEDNNISLGGGSTVVTPEDMAASYGTFANDGILHKAHFVKKLTNSSDETAYEFQDENAPAFDKDAAVSKQIAGNVTEALIPVIKHSNLRCPTGHECAGKTGTQQYELRDGDRPALASFNAQTWMVGYTPSVSAAAWVGGDGIKPLKGKDGRPIFGATIAGPMWQNFMSLYLTGKPTEKFPAVKAIGKDKDAAPPTPTTTPTTPTTTTPTTTPTTPTTTESEETDTQESTPTSPTRSRPGPPGQNPGGPGLGGGPALGSNGGGSGGALLPNDPAG